MASPALHLTELDAVNMMLASIGQTPVNTLSVSGIRDVAIAQLALQNETRAVLNQGWSFNTDYDWELTIDGSNEIPVPAAVIDIDPMNRNQDFVIRDDSGTLKLWDRENLTFSIGTNHDSPVKVKLIHAFTFETIPNVVRHYIATRAARIFQSQVVSSDILFRFTSQHEAEAYAAFMKLEARTKDRNWFTSGADSNEIANRRRNAWR